jgi:hypothetical protein
VSALVLLMVSDLEAGKMKKASAEDSFVFILSSLSQPPGGAARIVGHVNFNLSPHPPKHMHIVKLGGEHETIKNKKIRRETLFLGRLHSRRGRPPVKIKSAKVKSAIV